MKRRPRPGTRHRRLQKTMRSPVRLQRRLRSRYHRQLRTCLVELHRAEVDLYRNDDRLVPPAYLWDSVYSLVPENPRHLVVLSGGLA